MEWGTLAEHVKAVKSVRMGRELMAEGTCLRVEAGQVASYRLDSTHLQERLSHGDYETAAFGGLQDSAPRAALVGLHARVHHIGPDAWEAPALTQIWLRWADYVVPRSAIGLFTLGAVPRDAGQRAALDELADAVLAVLDGRPRPTGEVVAAIPTLPSPHLLRTLSMTGKIHIRWDARSTTLLPAEPAKIDEEEARLGLARRFLHWLGPASQWQFARWAGICRSDAEASWKALQGELAPVSLEGAARWILASDQAALEARKAPVEGVRLLSLGDPYLYLDGGVVVPGAPRHIEARQPGPGVSQRLLNSLTGRLVIDGQIMGSWGRVGHKVTVALWAPVTASQRDRVAAEINTLSRPLGTQVLVRWLD